MGLTFLLKVELAVKGNSHVGYLFQYTGTVAFLVSPFSNAVELKSNAQSMGTELKVWQQV